MTAVGFGSGNKAVSLLPCVAYGPLYTCGVATAGIFTGRGVDLANAQRVSSPYAAVGLRQILEVRVSDRFYVGPRADLTVALVRTGLTVGGREVWRTFPVAFSLGLGVRGDIR